MENNKGFKFSQYACAVLLISSSIALVSYQVVEIDDVASGLLEPARLVVGPVIVCSGFRCEEVNRRVGGVSRSQHLTGQAADIRPQDPSQYPRLVEFLKACEYTDQLLTGSTWLHVSWTPLGTPRHQIRIGYYK